MAWSTRQLADLAGTTVKAVRHYHKVGLLEEPERLSNGYKQYQVPHLIRLLQIVRLAELGVPLSQIATLDRSEERPDDAIAVLDAELAATIARLQRVREELAVILQHRSPAALPARFAPLADRLTEPDQSLVMIYSRVFDDEAIGELERMIRDNPVSAAEAELVALPADADRDTRRRLGEELAPDLAEAREAYPWLRDPGAYARHDAADAEATVGRAVGELYNLAQLEVLHRANLIATGQFGQLGAFERALANKEDEG
ncbi:MerR family DNA-binding transcriptional regulator [Microbacterium invictum]|uniref:MerR family DNA-binding transcriptional regulator n=1 Tax=Microbacterium invictum TaxID=515415 RepID=A0ABZ0V894_9MICO|nr:MerR family DNA-binding transcriptional regulator [Microbacterium invictum]WQB69851.1 MerR family DNA-binding transcriptional regulator [Microbacterium invictum]